MVKVKRDRLGQWKRGASGNPEGRPKRRKITDQLNAELEAICPWDPKARTYREVVAESILNQAAEGNLFAIKELLDRTEGKPHQRPSVAVDVEVAGEMVAAKLTYDELKSAEAMIRGAVVRSALETNGEN